MDRGIFVALSGALLHEKRLEVLTDNLANVNTAGFKKQKPVFEDSMPDGYGVRSFSSMKSTVTDMSQGVAEKTGRPLDAAIMGNGFFAIQTPEGERYTRDGSFTVGPGGTLMTKQGHPVVGTKGQVKINTADVSIDATGKLTGPGGAVIDSLKLVDFKNTGSLVREGSYYSAPSGTAAEPVSPNTQVQQGYIETSNVNAIKAMTTMIEAQRSYETQTKMIQSMDEITKKTIDEVGRT